MYKGFFGFRAKPFNDKPELRFHYVTPAYAENFNALRKSVRQRQGLHTLTGPKGTGKSLFLHRLISASRSQDVQYICCDSAQLTLPDLADQICEQLDLVAVGKPVEEKLQWIQASFVERAEQGKLFVLAVDDAHQMADNTLRDLLAFYRDQDEPVMQLLLLGQPELEGKVHSASASLGMESGAVYRLEPLSASDVPNYIDQQLRAAGYQGEEIFSADAVAAITKYGGQSLQELSLLCDATLVIAHLQSAHKVTAEIVEEAAQQHNIENRPQPDETQVAEAADPAEQEAEDFLRRLAEEQKTGRRYQQPPSPANRKKTRQSDEAVIAPANEEALFASPKQIDKGGDSVLMRHLPLAAGLALILCAGIIAVVYLSQGQTGTPVAGTPVAGTPVAGPESTGTQSLPENGGLIDLSQTTAAPTTPLPAQPDPAAPLVAQPDTPQPEPPPTTTPPAVTPTPEPTVTQTTPQPVAPQLAAPQPVAPQPAAPQPAAPQPPVPEPTVAQTTPQPAAPQPAAPQPAAPQPAAPQPPAPQPPAPQPAAPQPAAPKPTVVQTAPQPAPITDQPDTGVPGASRIVRQPAPESTFIDNPDRHQTAPRSGTAIAADIAIPDPDRDTADNPQVRTLLRLAGAQIRANQLIEPQGDNALETLLEVLNLAPANRAALTGVQQISQYFFDQVATARQTRELFNQQAEQARRQQQDFLNRFALAKQEKEEYLRDINAFYIGQAILANRYKVDSLIEAETAQQNTQAYLENRTGQLQPQRRPVRSTPQISVASNAMLTPEQAVLAESRIDRLLARAKQQVAERRLVKPKRNSALSTYQQILELEPGNKQALAGLEFIMAQYLDWAASAAARGNPKRAKYFFDQAMEIDANNINLAQRIRTVRQQVMVTLQAVGQGDTRLAGDDRPVNLNSSPQLAEALLQSAKLGDANSVASLLSSGAAPDVADLRGNTALMVAARHGHVAVADTLLRRGAKPNRTNSFGETALMLAATGGWADMVQLLLDKGASPHSRDADGRTALINAAAAGHTDVAAQLLDKDADPDVRSKSGRTALMAAAWQGHEDIVRLFLQRNINIDTKNNDGWTALSHAAWQGHGNVVKLLLARGADSRIRNNDGQTPLMMASNRGHTDVVHLLQ